ncbi:hypothetical protein F0L68_03040 [Solihabitans fulvus]|uniref:CopG family transcriptional regulator n=1 Tax=Solihabitans fulvus TaxID=1892852 RepID=A0A5B2XTC9_9PSEU|nr:hypothetical protein [Solihabitans fulvus]KAA2266109.1 hypothetical protein F0L68_03040 [Solihabitans fulvus]
MSRRATFTLEESDEAAVSAFADPERAEHSALVAWAAEHGMQVGSSDAAVIRALLRAGAEALREQVLEQGYAQLAASRTDEETDERRTLRARYVERTDRRMPT